MQIFIYCKGHNTGAATSLQRGLIGTGLCKSRLAQTSPYLFTAKLLYMFRASQHPSSEVLKTVTAASGTGHNTGAATSLLRVLIGNGLCKSRLAQTSPYLFTAKLHYMFRVSQHPSSGVLKAVTTASGTGHNTGTAISPQRGLIGPRWRGVAVQVV